MVFDSVTLLIFLIKISLLKGKIILSQINYTPQNISCAFEIFVV